MRLHNCRHLSPWVVVLVLATPVLFAGCGNGNDTHVNQPPTAELTSAPPNGSEASFQIDLAWLGTDPEGRLDRFEYAIDPPSDFSEEEIANGGTGITSEEIPGQNGSPDVTRVSKDVNGQSVSFDWVHTLDTGGTFTFSATRPDSSGQDTLRVPTGRFTGMHAFYLRAVDAEGATSVPDHVAFTATTLAPVSRIGRPDLSGQDAVWTMGSTVSFAWTGQDPDGGAPPVRYLYRMIQVTGSTLLDFDSRAFFNVPDSEWDTTEDLGTPFLHPATPGQYVFAVRAVDVAGAVEPFLEWGRNAFRFQAFASAGVPTLTVTESHAGTFAFTGLDSPAANAEIITGLHMHFTWQATAENYASSIWSYSWGVDLVNPDDPAGWSPWGQYLTGTPNDIVFTSPGPHTFHVRVEDVGGGITRGTINLDVAEATFAKSVLLVDDSFDDTYPRDFEHDAFWTAMLLGSGLPSEEIGVYSVFGADDRGSLTPVAPTLADLAQYRLLLWSNYGKGYNGLSGLTLVAGLSPLLRTYLDAGGMLWLEGRINIAATIPDVSLQRGDLNYPKVLTAGQFPYDVLKLHTTRVNDDKGVTYKNNLYKVRPFPGRPAVLDSMSVDKNKQSAALKGLGITFTDAVFDPVLDHQQPGFTGVLDSLYVYAATGNEVQASPSTYQNRLVAVRWHDPDPPELHGRIQWFGFPLYYFNDSEAQETVNRSLDWFLGAPQAAPREMTRR